MLGGVSILSISDKPVLGDFDIEKKTSRRSYELWRVRPADCVGRF